MPPLDSPEVSHFFRSGIMPTKRGSSRTVGGRGSTAQVLPTDPKLLPDVLVSLYGHLRTVRMNQKYNEMMLHRYGSWNSAIEIMIAVCSSSAIGTWAIWKSEVGTPAWAVLSGIAAVLAIAKPLLGLPDKIQRYSKLSTGMGDLFFDLSLLAESVRIQKEFTPEMARTMSHTLERIKQLSGLEEAYTDRILMKKCFEDVNIEIPVESLWMPPSPPASPQQ
jgi:hypothetical protein